MKLKLRSFFTLAVVVQQDPYNVLPMDYGLLFPALSDLFPEL